MKPGNLRRLCLREGAKPGARLNPWTIRVKGAAFEIMPFLMCIYVSEGLFIFSALNPCVC